MHFAVLMATKDAIFRTLRLPMIIILVYNKMNEYPHFPKHSTCTV